MAQSAVTVALSSWIDLSITLSSMMCFTSFFRRPISFSLCACWLLGAGVCSAVAVTVVGEGNTGGWHSIDDDDVDDDVDDDDEEEEEEVEEGIVVEAEHERGARAILGPPPAWPWALPSPC